MVELVGGPALAVVAEDDHDRPALRVDLLQKRCDPPLEQVLHGRAVAFPDDIGPSAAQQVGRLSHGHAVGGPVGGVGAPVVDEEATPPAASRRRKPFAQAGESGRWPPVQLLHGGAEVEAVEDGGGLGEQADAVSSLAQPVEEAGCAGPRPEVVLSLDPVLEGVETRHQGGVDRAGRGGDGEAGLAEGEAAGEGFEARRADPGSGGPRRVIEAQAVDRDQEEIHAAVRSGLPARGYPTGTRRAHRESRERRRGERSSSRRTRAAGGCALPGAGPAWPRRMSNTPCSADR